MINYAKTLKNSKIHIVFWFDDSTMNISMTILMMDEKFRYNQSTGEGYIFKAKNKIEIRSVNSPSFSGCILYLRGSQIPANNTCSTCCSDYNTAVSRIDGYITALEEWSNNCGVFGDVITINTEVKKLDIRKNLKRMKELTRDLKIERIEFENKKLLVEKYEKELKQLKDESKKIIEEIK